MTDIHNVQWQEFEALGEIEVRKRLAARTWGEVKEELARHWLEYLESADSSDSRRQTLAIASEANDLARSANEAALEANSIARESSASAKRSAEAARNSNMIATLALIAAVIAIATSIIGLFLKT